jgi:hypothetical protein
MRHQIGKRLRLRRAPEVTFVFDESIGHQDRVEQLLREIADAPTAPDAPSAPDAPKTSDTDDR